MLDLIKILMMSQECMYVQDPDNFTFKEYKEDDVLRDIDKDVDSEKN